MIRPAVLVAAAAAALILAPTTAMAQAPAGVRVSVGHRAPAALPFAVTASGAKANELVTLTVTPKPASIGNTSFTHRANDRGVVSFELTLADDGIYVLTTKSASGAVLSTETVTVSQHGSVLVAGTSASASTTAGATTPKPAGATAPKAAGATAPKAAGATAPKSAGTAAPAGLPFAITASGAKANEWVTLTIIPKPASIGNRSFTHRANARGVVSFELTLTDDGIYLLTTKSASGRVLSTETVTVSQHGSVLVAGTSASASTTATTPQAASATPSKAAAATAGTAAGPIAGTGAGTAAPGQLAFTGWRGMGLAGGGGVLV